MPKYVDNFNINGTEILVMDSEGRELINQTSQNLNGRIDTLQNTKANATDVASLSTQISNKADNATVNNLQAQVTGLDHDVVSMGSTLTGMNSAIGVNSSDIATLSARVDQITELPEGSTSGDAELIDMRTGAFGQEYSSAGVALRSQIEYLWKNAVLHGGANMLMPYLGAPVTQPSGITVSHVSADVYNVNGTNASSGNLYSNIVVMDSSIPYGFLEGDRKMLVRKTQDANTATIIAQLFYKVGDGDWTILSGIGENDTEVTVPANATGILLRLAFDQSGTWSNVKVKLIARKHMNEDFLKNEDILPDNFNLNNMNKNTFRIAVSGNTYSNAPSDPPFEVIHFQSGNAAFQMALSWAVGVVYIRRGLSGVWTSWVEISGSGGSSINYYENTYNITASPVITTSSNNYLPASGNSNDRTTDIETMLASTGICNLGPGDFYVDGIVMPDNTSIVGSGSATRLILVNGSNKFCIQLGSECSVRDLKLVGSLSPITLSADIGNRNGIVWAGTYSVDQKAPDKSLISRVLAEEFTGAGFRFYNTGYSTDKCVMMDDCYANHCCVGVNIEYWSEFNKFCNVRTPYCYYGCINNGGNNMFVNCDFSSCKVAFTIDNGSDQSPNSAHGSAIGCVFNHSNSNNGYGIVVLGTDAGFVFQGCQIFFSKTQIVNSDGIIFNGCNYGNLNTDIEISGGGAILFQGNMHQAQPNITITNNAHVVFDNCYVRSTGASITP